MESQMTSRDRKDGVMNRSKLGLYISGFFGLTGLAIMTICAPFVLPALRKHCLPYVPATDTQLKNLKKALRSHATPKSSFLDIGSGDGRICRLAANSGIFSQVDGVELNYILVLISRVLSINSIKGTRIKYHHKNLWSFPIYRYDSMCIFGVESMMNPFREYLVKSNSKPQVIYACRFPIPNMQKIDEIGEGIDTVWVYRVPSDEKV